MYEQRAAAPGLDPGTLRPASGDASFRRYFRVDGANESFIAMDSPPDQEDARPFVRVAGFLADMRLNAPRVLAADPDAGFLLLTDLGSRHYLDALRDDPARAAALYGDALDALAVIQNEGQAVQDRLPPYDRQRLLDEMNLFRDWLCMRHLGIEFDAPMAVSWQQCRDALADAALAQTAVFVHRDYHSRNLMVSTRQNPGILDFQDAMCGPLTYDLVSLLRDCYIEWPVSMVHDLALAHRDRLGARLRAAGSADSWMRDFDLTGAQRHLKAAGIFARLNHRDGKPGYLADIPRTLRYIAVLGDAHPEIRFVAALIRERVLPRLEATT